MTESPTLKKDNRILPPGGTRVDTGGLQDGITKITAALKRDLNEEEFVMIQAISRRMVNDGLKFDDAVLLANYLIEDVREVIDRHPLVQQLFKMKQLEKKAKWLSTMHKKADTDSSAAQWMLENEYQDEYGKKRKGDNEGVDPVKAVLNFIQETGDSEPIVKEESAMPANISKDGGKTMVARLKDFLA